MSVLVRTFRSSSHIFFTALLAVASLGLLALSTTPANAQETFEVNLTSDGVGQSPGDANPGDGDCDADANQAGNQCTLRAAITEANADADADEIRFSNLPISGNFATISLSAGELVVTEEVEINGSSASGWSEPGPPIVVLDGSSLSGPALDGLEISGSSASGTEVQGLGIQNFPDDGIQVLNSANNIDIFNCYIGVGVDGTSDEGNESDGIYTNSTTSGHNIGLRSLTQGRNVISGNGDYGIVINGGADNVANNYIGTTADGTSALGNGEAGIRITGGSGTEIGIYNSGFDTSSPNTISGNSGPGIELAGGTTTVITNQIGTTPDGSSAVPNAAGISVTSDGHTIGSSSNSAEGNIISGNDGNGIAVGNGNTSADGLTIEGNTIGLNEAEDSTLPNGTDSDTSGGLVCNRSSNTGSGNTTTVSGNTIAGNAGQGMWITENCLDWNILDNYVGTNSNYATGLGNNYDGVQVKSNPSDNGGEVEVVENIIGDNTNDGVDIRGSYHDVANNYIGVSPNGTDIGNDDRGIVVDGTTASLTSVFLGGTDSIPGDGSAIGNSTPNGNGNVVGNNGPSGLVFEYSAIRVQGEASEFVIAQNYVGTNPDGDDFGNRGAGIRIVGDASSSDHEIGYGPGASISSPAPADGGDGNVIAYSGTKGIVVGTDASATDVSNTSVRGNIVYQNGDADNMDIGIDLGDDGVTTNDNSGDDADTGPNNLQNFPIIEDVTYDESNDNVSISYRVQTTTSNAAYPLTIDFYAADSEQSGEGQTYIGSQEYTSGDARSSVTNVIDLSSFSDITSDDHFVATATDANGNTSEFVSTAEELPVELATFEGTQTGASSVELRWTTASEQNNAGFRVQHKAADDNNWQKLGFVESKADGGTTSDARTYRFATEDLAAGTHQFRLKQMDLDGTPYTHKAIPVEVQMQQPLQLSAPAPHPVQSRATLSFAVKEKQETTLRLYNTLGQRVATLYRGTPTAGETQTVQLSATDLTSGTYFLRLQTGERTRTQRVTIVR
jgi:hypothetical protein